MWDVIITLSIIVFLSRYVFLEPKLPFKLNRQVLHILEYTSPAVLTAIWAPIVFVHGDRLNLNLDSSYIMATLVAVIIAVLTRNVLLTTIISMVFFFFIH